MNAMKQCLRCGKACEEPSIFCESCQSSLLSRAEQKLFQTEPMLCPTTKILPTTKMIKEGDIDSTALGRRPLPWVTRRAAIRRTRRMFIALALLIIAALVIDGILVTLVLKHSSHTTQASYALPLLAVTPGIAYTGQSVQLHLSRFSPFSRVLLTRDVQQPLRVDAPSSHLSMGISGNATVRVLIEGNWSVGVHFIVAEDSSTHYTASATLQVMGSRSVLPSPLSISPPQLAFTISQGQASRGAQHLTLANTGRNTLTWRDSIRSSATAWLTLAAAQGTLGAEQVVALPVDTNAGNLLPGTYNAQIIVSTLDNSGRAVAGSPQVISVVLIVAQPCVLHVIPTTLSFSSSLLQRDPMDQVIHLNVMGNCSLPVSWQTSNNNSAWLLVTPLTGTENGAGSSINVHVDTSIILPGSYNEQIIFSAQDNTDAAVSMSPRMISVNLDVLE